MIDPDGDLLPAIARGDQYAIKQMVARKLPRLLALTTRMLGNRGEAEDLAQETFIRIWKHAAEWQPGQARFDTWMHQVALNLCYDRLRARREYAEEDDSEQIDTALIPEEYLSAQQQRDKILVALSRLPSRQREALILQYYQELSNIEAATLMGISIDALESLLSRARRNMRTLLLDQGVSNK